MRQGFDAFKAASAIGMKKASILGLLLLVQSCSVLGGNKNADLVASQGEELRIARAQTADLQETVAKLTAENEALTTKVADLEKKSARLAALEPNAPETTLKEGPAASGAPTPEKKPSTAPAAPVVAAPNADVALPGAPVPVDNSPRLVQPSFASTEEIFENEAESPEIKLTSILWGVHLASYRQAEDASAGWQKLQRENPDELGLLEPRIEKVSVEGKGEYLRLVGGGFSSREKAKALCDTLAAKGVFCRVATFGGDKLSMLDIGDLR
ncbi:MAG: SPOR domain-containing protein [Parvularculaceae bacterium]|nr:SPOR domain-containing protein [Parvularculaceae bacterium]